MRKDEIELRMFQKNITLQSVTRAYALRLLAANGNPLIRWLFWDEGVSSVARGKLCGVVLGSEGGFYRSATHNSYADRYDYAYPATTKEEVFAMVAKGQVGRRKTRRVFEFD